MAFKPEIQYVERFYVYGSEAPAEKQAEQQKNQKTPKLPKLEVHKIYVDLGALIWTAAAIVLLAAMVFSGLRLNRMWQEKELMQSYVANLQLNHSTLQHNYRTSYNLEEVEKQARELGLVPEDQVETRYIRVSVPEPEDDWTFLGNVKWFFEGLFE